MKRYVNATQQPGSDWREVATKQVLDSDGFLTDYTMYTDGKTYIFMFGDKDLYEPDIDYADWEAETEERAWEWFNSYTGFADEDDDDYSLYGSEEVDDESDGLDRPAQEFDSAKTSINSNKLPAIYKMISIPNGSVGLDFGGGSFDNAIEFIKDLGATLYVYDPYNRSAEYNKQTIKALRDIGGADWAVNSNVLNVIKEPEARRAVLENISKITKPGAPIYITVYEGRGDSKEGPTKSGYQLNRKTQDYLQDIQEVFPDATRKGKLITAHNNTSSESTADARYSSIEAEEDIYDLDKDNVIKAIMHKLDINKDAASIIYSWYDAEDAFEDFDSVSDLVSYVKDDIYDMLDACTDDAERDIVETALEQSNRSVNGSTDSKPAERWAQIDLTSDDEYCYCGNGGRSWVTKDSDAIDTWPTKEAAIANGKQTYKRTFKYGRDWDVVKLDKNLNASDELSQLDQYNKISFCNSKYSVHYNLIDCSPEADAHQMWLDFQATVSPIKPYDDADYAWARIKNGNIDIIRNGQPITTYYYFDADDVEVEKTDWCDALIEVAMQYLEIANKDITPRIIHNSTDIKSEDGASIIESADITESADGYVYTYCDNCGKRNRVKVHFKDYFSPFDDIEYKCPYCGGRNLLHDPHIYDESGHVVNTSEDIYSEPAEVTDFKNAVNSADTIDDIQFLIYELSDGVAEEACQFAFDTALNSEVDDINTIKHEVISAIDMYLEDNEWLDLSGSDDLDFIESSQKLDASTDNKLTKLKDEILSAVKDVMMSPNFGFLEDEVQEYSVVEVHPEGRVEVRAEVDYDGLMELISALNPIIQKYDKDSYFEPVEPGIIEAYLHI